MEPQAVIRTAILVSSVWALVACVVGMHFSSLKGRRMNPNPLNFNQIRVAVDQLKSLVMWIPGLILAAIFFASVFREAGASIPMIPVMDGMKLATLGIAFFFIR